MGGRECCKYFEDFAMGGVGTEASFAQWRTMCQSKCLVHLCKFGKKERNVCILPLGVLYSCMKADTCLTTLPSPQQQTLAHTHLHVYSVYRYVYCLHTFTHTHTCMHKQWGTQPRSHQLVFIFGVTAQHSSQGKMAWMHKTFQTQILNQSSWQ